MIDVDNIHKSVRALIISGDGAVLVVTNNDCLIDLPKGRLEQNESPIEAVIRNLYEEIGLKVKNLFPILSMFDSEYLCTTFVVKSIGIPVHKKGLKIQWVNPSHLIDKSLAQYPEYNIKLFEYINNLNSDTV